MLHDAWPCRSPRTWPSTLVQLADLATLAEHGHPSQIETAIFTAPTIFFHSTGFCAGSRLGFQLLGTPQLLQSVHLRWLTGTWRWPVVEDRISDHAHHSTTIWPSLLVTMENPFDHDTGSHGKSGWEFMMVAMNQQTPNSGSESSAYRCWCSCINFTEELHNLGE